MGSYPSNSPAPVSAGFLPLTKRLAACMTLVSLASLVGCSGFMPVKEESQANLSNTSIGVYVVEVRERSGKPESKTKSLPEGLTLNQALTEAGVAGRRGAWEVELIRTNPQNGMRHKMMVDYDATEREVPVEQDYAIYPDDHIIARQSTANPFDDLVGGFFGSPGK